jgi:HlyD family secretion protein
MNKKAKKAAKKEKKAARAAVEDTEQQGEIPDAPGEIHADVAALKKDIKKSGSKRFLFIALAAVLAVAGTIFVWHLISAGSNRLQYATQPAAFTDITASVTETGTVNAINQVSIGSEVSGTIKSIRVDFNSTVKAGQTLATLDPTTYQAAENSAQASLELARASLNSAKRTSKKMMDLVDMANLTLQRDKGLNDKGLVDGNQVDLDRTAAEAAQQDYLVAQAQIQVATSQVNVSFGQLQQSQFSLSKTIIVSPYDGIIILRNVSIGQTVAASLQTPTLFMLATSTLPITATSGAKVSPADSSALSAPPPVSTSSQSPLSLAVSLSPVSPRVIAAPAATGASTALATSIQPSAVGLTDMQVDTSVDEADVGTVSDGETAQISVPAFPNVIFPGTVLQVRINPTIVQNVVTYDAVVTVHDTTGRLFPGMTAQVDIITATRTHVLSVPVSAVLYRPLAGKAGNAAHASVTSGAGVAQIGKATSPGAAVAGAPGSKVTVWVLRDGKPVAVKVVIGLSDSKNMEVISGTLAEGDPLITAEGNDGTP